MKKKDIEAIEMNLLLEAIDQRYGYDFRLYAKQTIKRRVQDALQKSDCKNLTEMTRKLLYDESFFQWLLAHFSITVTEWFRDPLFYRTLREKVFPYLRTFPFFKIWHAGCATGEEVYSLAILLKEEGLYDKATIFATDFNDNALTTARNGVYPVKEIQEAAARYHKAGGTGSLSEVLHAQHNSAIVARGLKKNITFANHNLATDSVFGEIHLILSRNVLIYFDKALQNRAFNLFKDSQVYKGFLCLGSSESLDFSDIISYYKTVDKKHKIYQRTVR